MEIQYCRLGSICGEIFSFANMPAEVNLIDLTPQLLYRWEAPIPRSHTESGGCMWARTALQDTSNSPKKRQAVTDNSSYIRLFQQHIGVILQKPWGCQWFQPFLYLQVRTRMCTSVPACVLWHSSELLEALPCPLSRVLLCPEKSPAWSLCAPPPLRK